MERQPDSYDFSDLVSLLQQYFASNEEFKDIDWKGSTASRLISLLSYNTSIRAANTGFALGESSLASATIRRSAAAKASGFLNYLPASRKSAELFVNITVQNTKTTPDTEVSFDRSLRFTGTNDGVSLNFVSEGSNHAEYDPDGNYYFKNVRLLQGIRVTNSYLVKTAFSIEPYVIPNQHIDTNTLKVSVKEGDNLRVYERYTHPRQLTSGARLYFLRVNPRGEYVIEFGDDKFCRRLRYGETVVLDYIATEGAAGNGAARIAASGSINDLSNIKVVITSEYSKGGADEESLESIKRLAPLGFGMTGACVTSNDYVSATKAFLGDNVSIAAWGGEENLPPKYGYVFIAAKPLDADVLSQVQKDNLFNYLSELNVGQITPIVKDGDFTYINTNVYFTFIRNKTVLNKSQLETKMRKGIERYSSTSLERFRVDFIQQEFAEYIKKIDPAFQSTSAEYTFHKRDNRVEAGYIFSLVYDFGFKIQKGSTIVSGFKPLEEDSELYEYTLVENETGELLMQRKHLTIGSISYFPGIWGYVDYTKGQVYIQSLMPDVVDDYRVTVKNANLDQSILADRDSIFKFDKINVVGEER